MKRFGFFGFLTAFLVVGTLVAQPVPPDYDLSIPGVPGSITKDSPGGGAVLDAPMEVECILTESNNVDQPGTLPDGDDPDEDPDDYVAIGAQGWSISVAGENLDITDITTAGTTVDELFNGGFNATSLTDAAREGSPCEGLLGGASAVVLSFQLPITLPVNESAVVAKLTVEGGVFPEQEVLDGEDPVEVGTARLLFADGCKGLGQPVDNNVTWIGKTVKPTVGDSTVTLIVKAPDPICPNPNSALQVVGQSAVAIDADSGKAEIMGPPFDAADRIPNQVDTPDPMLPGVLEIESPVAPDTAAGELFLAIVSQGLDIDDPENPDTVEAVQGWSLAIAVDEAISLDDATVIGTIADTGGVGIFNGGFNATQMVDPLVEPTSGALAGLGPQGQGAVSAIVLSFQLPITLAETGVATAFALTLSGSQGDTGLVYEKDGLKGMGQPVSNTATVAGGSMDFACVQKIQVDFVEPLTRKALIGDVNNDVKIDIADPIYLINELFRGGPGMVCNAAADVKEDGMKDLSDALSLVYYLFNVDLGGGTPSDAIGTCVDFDPAECEDHSAGCL